MTLGSRPQSAGAEPVKPWPNTSGRMMGAVTAAVTHSASMLAVVTMAVRLTCGHRSSSRRTRKGYRTKPIEPGTIRSTSTTCDAIEY